MKTNLFLNHRTLTLLSLLVLLLPFARPAVGQVSLAGNYNLVNAYVTDSYEQRSKAWWNALGRQLTLLIDVPYEQVNEPALQNIIFFAANHSEKVRLNDAVPKLTEIYLHHENVSYRMMALAALHAIGDEKTIHQLERTVRKEPSERIRKMTLAVLKDYYRKN